jgi:hypothetical protein
MVSERGNVGEWEGKKWCALRTWYGGRFCFLSLSLEKEHRRTEARRELPYSYQSLRRMITFDNDMVVCGMPYHWYHTQEEGMTPKCMYDEKKTGNEEHPKRGESFRD